MLLSTTGLAGLDWVSNIDYWIARERTANHCSEALGTACAAARARYRYGCFEDYGEEPQAYGYAARSI